MFFFNLTTLHWGEINLAFFCSYINFILLKYITTNKFVVNHFF